MFYFLEINTFIHQACNKLIKNDSKDMNNYYFFLNIVPTKIKHFFSIGYNKKCLSVPG